MGSFAQCLAEVVEEGPRINRANDLSVDALPPPSQPIGDGFATCEFTGEFDVDGRTDRRGPGQCASSSVRNGFVAARRGGCDLVAAGPFEGAGEDEGVVDVSDVAQTVPVVEFEVEAQGFGHLGQPVTPFLASTRRFPRPVLRLQCPVEDRLQPCRSHLKSLGGFDRGDHRQGPKSAFAVSVVEGSDDGRRRLGVEGDVPFGGREGVAAIVEGAAHDEESSHQAGQFGFKGKGESKVRRRSDDHADELSGVRPCRIDPGLSGTDGAGRRRRSWKLSIPGPVGSVGEVGILGIGKRGNLRLSVGVTRRPSCGVLASRVDGYVGTSGEFKPALGIDAHLRGGHVAARGRDADDVDIVLAQQIPEGDGIVDSGITVEEQRQAWRHVPYSAGISSPPSHHRLMRTQFGHGCVEPRRTNWQHR